MVHGNVAIAPVWIACFVVWSAAAHQALGQEPLEIDKPNNNLVDLDRVDRDIQAKVSTGFRNILSFPRSDEKAEFKPTVPLLVPSKLFSDLRRQSEVLEGDRSGFKTAGGSSSISFSNNGYFVGVPYTDFKVTVQSSSISYGTSTSGEADDQPKKDYYNGFTADYSGGVITFGYAGVDYLVMFECNVGEDDCIDEIKANTVMDTFVLCNAAGACVEGLPFAR